MTIDPTQFIAEHPRLSIFFAVTLVLALIGLWYVVWHHLQLILVTLLCASGMLAGGIVAYRGLSLADNLLIGSGLFLILVFPLIWSRALQSLRAGPAKPVAPSAEARYELQIKPKEQPAEAKATK